MSVNLKFVVLDNPISSFEIPFVKQLFTDLIEMKARGYRQHWSQQYIPASKEDFIGTHLIACIEQSGKLRPVSAYRSITKERCDFNKVKFPGYSLCDSTNSEKHINAVNSFVNKAVSSQLNIAYSSSFSVDPNLDVELILEAGKALTPLFAFHHLHYSINKSLSLGALKTKTVKMYRRLGLKPITYKGEKLDPIVFPEYDNSLFEVQVLEDLSPSCLESADKFIRLWKDRVHIYDNAKDRDLVEYNLKRRVSGPVISA